MRNHSIDTPWSIKVSDINTLMIQMMWSGHGYTSREIVANRILARYNSNMRNFLELGRPIYRSREERRLLPKKDKTNWFREDGTTATMAVPSTLGSSLANIIRNVIKSFPGPKGTRVRVLEVPGVPILRGLITNNPFKIRKCGRTKCPFMTHDEDCKEKCQIENIFID